MMLIRSLFVRLVVGLCLVSVARAADECDGCGTHDRYNSGRELKETTFPGLSEQSLHPPECTPQCKKGHWYTLGIPVVTCAHEEHTDWLVEEICKPDVSVSQLTPLLPDSEKCSLKGLKAWLTDNCNFGPRAALAQECRPRCKAPRWYTLGIPIPNCNQLEFDLWLRDYICNDDNPASVQDLVQTAENPDKCVLADLTFYLETTCSEVTRELELQEAVSASAYLPDVDAIEGKSSYDEPEMPVQPPESMYGAPESNNYNPDQYGYDTPAASGGAGNSMLDRASLPAQCTYVHDTGQCLSAITSYYFDSLEMKCKPFVYGGCGGNSNRFASIDECEGICLPSYYTQEAAAPFQLQLHSCGFVQGFSGESQTTPVVLNITGGSPTSQIAIFRALYTQADDPMSSVTVPDNLKCGGTPLSLGGSFQQSIKAWAVNTQSQGDAIFKIDDAAATPNDVCSQYVYQAIDMSNCKLSNVLDTRAYMG
jgi:hypothetical protein